MAITSIGYDGPINEEQFAKLAGFLGTPYAVAGQNDWAVTAVAGQDRTVSIAPGVGYGHGVYDTSTLATTLKLPVVASGSRWDLICMNRAWTPSVGGLSTFKYRTGTNLQALPGTRVANPGQEDDQPIALVQVTALQTLPTAILDLRILPSKVLTVHSLLAIPNPPLGTEAVVGNTRYRRVLDSNKNPIWQSDDTGWVLSGFLAERGWANTSSRYRTRNGISQLDVRWRRTGANIAPNAPAGGFIDVKIGRTPIAPSSYIAAGCDYASSNGFLPGRLRVDPGGDLVFASGSEGSTLLQNGSVTATFTWIE